MRFHREFTLKNGDKILIRSCAADDAEAVCDCYDLTHEETDYLLCYTDENSIDRAKEGAYLAGKEESPTDAELCAVLDGRIIATAGIWGIGGREKIKHRAEFGISIEKAYWGLGIGRALSECCIECAKRAGFSQLELEVVGENERAVSLYKSLGFSECGRNPRGFRSRYTGYQELVMMRLEL